MVFFVNAKRTTAAMALFVGLSLGLAAIWAQPAKSPKSSKETAAPFFKYDGSWPKLPLPNKWAFEGVTGLTVDKDDLIWVLHRPTDFDMDNIHHVRETTENYAALNPPTASCCVKPVAVLAFDEAGNLVHSWDVPADTELHLILADKGGNIWVGAKTIRKYTKEGKLLAEMTRVPEDPVKPGQYPPETPTIVGRIEGGYFDEAAREIYWTDGYLGGRIMVSDMDTLKFKRGWGAYGKPLSEISVTPGKYVPGGTPPKDFVNHLTIALSHDGFLYAADRRADRIQVFTKQGKFIREYTIAPETLDRGSTGGLAFSADPLRGIYMSRIS